MKGKGTRGQEARGQGDKRQGDKGTRGARVFHADLLPTNEEFRACVRLRLRLPVAPEALARVCQHVSVERQRCPAVLDPLGDHAVCCAIGGFLVLRHNETAQALEAALKTGKFDGVATEVLVPEWERDHPTKPGVRQAAVLDVSLVCKGQTEYVDVNVYHGFAGGGELAKRPRGRGSRARQRHAVQAVGPAEIAAHARAFRLQHLRGPRPARPRRAQALGCCEQGGVPCGLRADPELDRGSAGRSAGGGRLHGARPEDCIEREGCAARR